MEQVSFCQSCGMPMKAEDNLYGTNADGSNNEDYCMYCFKEGAFTSNMSMEEMIEFCVPHMVSGNQEMTEAAARASMQAFFPRLKRWAQSGA